MSSTLHSVKFEDEYQHPLGGSQAYTEARSTRSGRNAQSYYGSIRGAPREEIAQSQLAHHNDYLDQAHPQLEDLQGSRTFYQGGSNIRSGTAGGARHTYQRKYGLELPQPIGSGQYTNQLQLRTTQLKKGVDVFGSRNFTTSNKAKRPLSSSSVGNGESFSAHLQNQRTQEKLREKLYFDERTKTVPKSTIKNDIIEKILTDGEVFVANKDLMHSVYQLKKLHLLRQNQSHINRSTNNGYSRQVMGGFFFTK